MGETIDVRRRRAVAGALAAGAGLSFSGCASVEGAQLAPSPVGALEMVRRGAGSPVFVLMHGLGQDLGTWRPLLDPLAARTTVIAFNRPGYGNSAWTEAPREGEAIAGELIGLMSASGAPAPFVLVGHSFGGLYAWITAQLFPQSVAGLLLVDPTAPGQTALLRAEMPGAAAMLEASMAGQLPMVRREFEAAERAEAFSAARAPYRAGPVIVLAAQKKDMISSEAYWTQRQRKLEELAAGAGGVLTPVESGHFIQREAPEAVLAAADQLLSKLRV